MKLKGLCHEDFAVLGQFCAKVIYYLLPTYCLEPYTKCSCRVMKKISNKFNQLTKHSIVLSDF